MRLAVPDLVSNSYFPAIAAVELGYLRDEGIDVTLDLLFPVADAVTALHDGDVDVLAGAAHAPLYVDPEWGDVRLIATLARNMYWFLVVRSDLDIRRDSLAGLRGLRIGAAPGPDLGLRRLLAAEAIDTTGMRIAPVPGGADNVSFGVSAAQALADGRVDAFWANGMGAEIAVRRGVGRVVVDARRDDSPASLSPFPALMTSNRMLTERPDTAAAFVRAVTRAQEELRRAPELATKVGRALFPEMEADLIAELVARDAEYYTPALSRKAIAHLVEFARECGLTTSRLTYDQIVWPAG